MKTLLFALLLSACKFSFTPASEVQRSSGNPIVQLNIAPQGLWLEVPGAAVPMLQEFPVSQAFYHVRTATQEFTAAEVNEQPLRTAPVTFSEIVLAWSNNSTWVCFLRDVTSSRTIEPVKENNCFQQDVRYDYLRQFVEWCVTDNKVASTYESPFFLNGTTPYCKMGKVSASNTVDIPLRCFTGNANMCFPPEKRSIRRAGRNDQRLPDRRFKDNEYYIANYLSSNDETFYTSSRGKTFFALLDDVYAQAADCRDGAGMEVRMTADNHPFYCYCPQHKNKQIILNGQQKKCGSTGYAYFFPEVKK